MMNVVQDPVLEPSSEKVPQKFLWDSARVTKRWVEKFVETLGRPCVILLSGELGVGKTQLVRWIVEYMGGRGVGSPSYAIHHRYPTERGPVDHVDLYRLQSDSDLESSGFWDLFENPSGMVFVEWADRLPESSWPHHWGQVHIHLEKSESSDARHARVEFR